MDAAAVVLVADADQTARASLARLLTNAGFRVLQAETGEQALALARSATPAADPRSPARRASPATRSATR